MKKTVTANISGLIFHIDEDAFEKLNKYLESLRKHFSNEEGGDEILSDIESRIAEMFQEKTASRKEVVSLNDVDDIISQLGQPGQIDGDEKESKDKSKTEEKSEPKYERREERRFYRDPDNKYIAGVASGLAAYFNIDPTWVRIAFVVFTFFYGFGPLAYLIMWIVVPRAETTAEKLSMKGERVNISNIEKSIKEDIKDLKVQFEKFSEENFGKSKKKGTEVKGSEDKLEIAILSFFRVVFKVFAIFFGLAFMIAGITALTIFILSFFTESTTLLNLPNFLSIPGFLSMFINELWVANIAMVGIALVVGLPIIMIISAGAGMTFRLRSKSKFWPAFSFTLWLIGLSFCVFSFIYAFSNAECKKHSEPVKIELNEVEEEDCADITD
ncbi:MAG: PspC domain-containing protein [Bacteroidetes bacterium]|nr:PspC domain-containing protein [Bacteroidota bacterium]